MRRATLPPVAAMPLPYSASAIGAKAPSSLATSRCAPGGSGSAPRLHAARRVMVAPLAVTYTTSRPSSGSASPEGLYSSISSSLAFAPPVTTSLMTRWPTTASTVAGATASGSMEARMRQTAMAPEEASAWRRRVARGGG
jgi:hypothetical protein